MKDWVIYALKNFNGIVFYVGFSVKPKRRLKEHKATYGSDITMEILHRGTGNGWSEIERRWISKLRSLGNELTNVSPGGYGTSSVRDSTRKKISELMKGRPVTWGDKISATLKGKKPDWSKDGELKVSATRFKKGIEKDPAVEEKRKLAQKNYLDSLTFDQRSSAMKKANKGWWERATPEQRYERTKKMVSGRDTEKIKENARKNGRITSKKHPEMFGNRIKEFWANMTPEYREDYLKRRSEKIRQAKSAKKTGLT